jgi:hypothetical protein
LAILSCVGLIRRPVLGCRWPAYFGQPALSLSLPAVGGLQLCLQQSSLFPHLLKV